MMIGARITSLAIALSVVTPIVAATARDVGAEPTSADKETARTLMADGRSKRGKGDLAGALEAFRAAHEIMQVPTTGLELGRTQIELGLLTEARETLLDVARMPKRAGEPAPFQSARQEAVRLSEEIAKKIPSVKIQIVGLADDEPAVVTVDGIELSPAATKLPRKVNPGSHRVAVRARGVERTTEVDAGEGAIVEATIDFRDVKKPAPVAAVPVEPPPLRGEEPADRPIERSGTSPLVYVGFGAAGVFGLVGAAAGVVHLANTSALRDKCPGSVCPPQYDDDFDRTRTFGHVSTIAFAAAGAGLAVGIVGLFVKPSGGASTPSGFAVQPTIGLSHVGVIGRF